jgi:serpin B
VFAQLKTRLKKQDAPIIAVVLLKVIALIALFILVLFGCTTVNPPVGLMSFKQLDDSKATAEGLNELVLANNTFAVDYYNKLDSNPENNGKNIFFSPFSISTALAMTYEGAGGNTAEEMRKVFYFPQDDVARQSSFAKLYNSLNESASKGNYSLNIANALWNETTYPLKQSFYDTVDNFYYGKSTPVDFLNLPDEQRQLINRWVEDQTNKRIVSLLPENSIKSSTVLVLTNAIYFKGDWASKFKSENTEYADFFVSEEKKITTKLMRQKEEFNYFSDEGFEYLELPYKGDDMSMIVLLPKAIQLDCGEKLNCNPDAYKSAYSFSIPSAEILSQIKSKMNKRELLVYLPKFKFEAEYKLKKDLQEMGVREAFENTANFSKMDAANYVKIDQVYHKAFVEVNEDGTEAAAATAVVVGKTSMPMTFNANHPFAFYIRDNKTGEILFLGKVVDPTLTK